MLNKQLLAIAKSKEVRNADFHRLASVLAFQPVGTVIESASLADALGMDLAFVTLSLELMSDAGWLLDAHAFEQAQGARPVIDPILLHEVPA